MWEVDSFVICLFEIRYEKKINFLKIIFKLDMKLIVLLGYNF